jgi:integrase/recombinase XerD
MWSKNFWGRRFERYLIQHTDLTPGNIYRTLSCVKRAFELTGKQWNEFKVRDVFTLKEIMLRQGYKKSYINNVLKALRHWFNWRGRKLKVKLLNPGEPLPRILMEEQVEALLNATLERNDWRAYALFVFMLHTGLRASEVCALKIRDVDFRRRIVYVYNPKNKRDDASVFSEFCAAVLHEWLSKQHPQTTDALFVDAEGNPLTYDALYYIFRKYSAIVGFKVTPHMLRHTLATHLLLNGIDVMFVKEQLRHKSLKSTMRYLFLKNKLELRRMYDAHLPAAFTSSGTHNPNTPFPARAPSQSIISAPELFQTKSPPRL